MSKRQWVKGGAILAVGGLAVVVLLMAVRTTSLGDGAFWQRQASPGTLSAAHAFLQNDCGACHAAVRGPEAARCIACHANNQLLLQRQPTSFHADIGSCRRCHFEHQGLDRRPTHMDHVELAMIGLRKLNEREGTREQPAQPKQGKQTEQAEQTERAEQRQHRKQTEQREQASKDGPRRLGEDLRQWISRAGGFGRESFLPRDLSPYEAVLNCAACHANQDPHFKLFGQDCAQCHGTARWTIPEFRHPSPRSTDCAQCHQAPPSHYMGHFHMVSAKVAGKPHAKVNECHICHETTSWNDIRGVGWYKHH